MLEDLGLVVTRHRHTQRRLKADATSIFFKLAICYFFILFSNKLFCNTNIEYIDKYINNLWSDVYNKISTIVVDGVVFF